MTDITAGFSTRQQEKHTARKANFFSQTNEQNAQRIENNVNDMERVKDELKFIESILLAEHGHDV